jgi:hypothetical protein
MANQVATFYLPEHMVADPTELLGRMLMVAGCSIGRVNRWGMGYIGEYAFEVELIVNMELSEPLCPQVGATVEYSLRDRFSKLDIFGEMQPPTPPEN